MAESNNNQNNIYNANDTLDINELASLNEEITSDFIEQLQGKISSEQKKNDGDLFEEVTKQESKSAVTFNNEIDDNFIKKYKAKLQKQQNNQTEEPENAKPERKNIKEDDEDIDDSRKSRSTPKAKEPEEDSNTNQNEVQSSPEPEIGVEDNKVSSEPVKADMTPVQPESSKDDIKNLSGGNISVHPLTEEKKNYKESLDYLDSNVKYSKYVIYIDPENKDFIDSLTVKERKNLINRILREQDAIAVTKRKLSKLHAIITHTLIALFTISLAVPALYWVFNTSLEITINNYRQSQSAFEVLYREKGKLKRAK